MRSAARRAGRWLLGGHLTPWLLLAVAMIPSLLSLIPITYTYGVVR